MKARRMKLISDVMEDYQENMRRAFRLIECELEISNNVFPPTIPANLDDWVDRGSNITDRYPETHDFGYERRDTPEPRSPNRSNVRRGFVYTQLLEPRDPVDRGITNEQIATATQLIQYDLSMNETRCPITWDQFEPGQNILQINSCRHIFGHQPLMEWFQRHSRCPVCRTNVLTNASTEPENINNALNSTAISQLISGILTSVNGAVNTENDYDLLDAYTQLVISQPSNSQNTNED